ncbi:MAG: hypothetical protein GY940_44675, partial [bacterium]|nr:hypothetical protein [bacterium]
VKLEAVLLKIGALTGTKQRAASNSAGGNSSETTEGTLYQYTWNPNSLQGFDWWDIFETAPTSLTIGSAQEMGLNLSGIRVMIGVSF